MLFALAFPQGLSAEGLRGGFDDAFGPRFHPDARQAPPDLKHRPRHGFDRAGVVRHWNQIGRRCQRPRPYPGRSGGDPRVRRTTWAGSRARAMAIVHLAIFEVVNAVEGDFKSYVGLPHAKLGTSMQVGVAQAAHDTLCCALSFPSGRRSIPFSRRNWQGFRKGA